MRKAVISLDRKHAEMLRDGSKIVIRLPDAEVEIMATFEVREMLRSQRKTDMLDDFLTGFRMPGRPR